MIALKFNRTEEKASRTEERTMEDMKYEKFIVLLNAYLIPVHTVIPDDREKRRNLALVSSNCLRIHRGDVFAF